MSTLTMRPWIVSRAFSLASSSWPSTVLNLLCVDCPAVRRHCRAIAQKSEAVGRLPVDCDVRVDRPPVWEGRPPFAFVVVVWGIKLNPSLVVVAILVAWDDDESPLLVILVLWSDEPLPIDVNGRHCDAEGRITSYASFAWLIKITLDHYVLLTGVGVAKMVSVKIRGRRIWTVPQSADAARVPVYNSR